MCTAPCPRIPQHDSFSIRGPNLHIQTVSIRGPNLRIQTAFGIPGSNFRIHTAFASIEQFEHPHVKGVLIRDMLAVGFHVFVCQPTVIRAKGERHSHSRVHRTRVGSSICLRRTRLHVVHTSESQQAQQTRR